MAQMVERVLGKDEVTGSIPVISSKIPTVHRGYLILKNGQTSGLTKERERGIPKIFCAAKDFGE